MEQKQVAIVHFNTPELTEATILSLRKHGGKDYHVTVFDNSDTRPFVKPMEGVTIIDNTRGQIIDFEKELAKYELEESIGCGKNCRYGSAKHMMTIHKLWELFPQGFVLMESDILLKKPIDEFFRPEYSIVGYVQKEQKYNPYHIGRVLPMLCWYNVPMLMREGAKIFDPKRCYGIAGGGRQNKYNWYDTGAALLEDILKKRPRLKGLHIDIRNHVEHYENGSWRKNSPFDMARWLRQHEALWMPETFERTDSKMCAVCAIGRMENRYAVEWVDHYLKLGFDKIFIYDNNFGDEEHFEEVLAPYIKKKKVEIIPYRNILYSQKPAYNDCYRRHGHEYQWIAFFDFDEFLILPEGETMKDFMALHKDADLVALNWQMMQDSGLTNYDPRPCQERFTVMMPYEMTRSDGTHVNDHMKSIVRGGLPCLIFDENPHMPGCPKMTVENGVGEKVPQRWFSPFNHKGAFLRHFNMKTIDEFLNFKCKRGFPTDDAYNAAWDKTRMAHWYEINGHTDYVQKWLEANGYDENGYKMPKVEVENGDPAVVVPEEKPKKAEEKAASKREQIQTGLSSAEREQAHQGDSIGKPKTKKRTNRKGK